MTKTLLFILTSLPAIWHIVLAHRGDDEEEEDNPRAPDKNLVSLETLPKGQLHTNDRKVRSVSAHDFQTAVKAHEKTGKIPSSFIEEGSAQHDIDGVDEIAAPGPAGIILHIEYPKATDGSAPAAGGGSSAPQEIHVVLGDNPTATAVAAPAAVAQDHTDHPGWSAGPSVSDKKIAWVGKDFAGLFETVSTTVVRIQTISADVNWFEPYQQPRDMMATGSGFAVSLEGVPEIAQDPIFITNAHVVRDAHDVQIQLPAIGQEFFEAYVPLICEEFDLAVVQLVNPQAFLEALRKAGNAKLEQLPVRNYPLILGLEVASVGFPLGSTSLKLSRGVISGTEEVGDFICYQTTAPISPGSSGGPLFALDKAGELRVIGATFASSAAHGAQNLNYVVPTVAIYQVLEQYRRERAKYKQAQIAPPQAPEAAAQASQATLTIKLQADKQNRNPFKGPFANLGPLTGPFAALEVASASTPEPMFGPSSGSGNINSTSIYGGRKAELSADIAPSAAAVGPLLQDAGNLGEELDTYHRHHFDNGGGSPQDFATLAERVQVESTVYGPATSSRQTQKNKMLPHFQFKIAPIDAVGIEANKALYNVYGCKNGIFISKILKTSVFANADPPVKERSFLTIVNGVHIDEFGMGRDGEFLNNPIPFESLMMMKVKPGDKVTIETCGQGADEKAVQHVVDMEWDASKYVVGINNIEEPFWNEKCQEYETFAGITVMQLTVNHIIRLLRAGEPPTLGRWLLPEMQEQPRLLITHVERGNYADRTLSPGMVISKVNNQEIGTLEEYRKVFQPAADQRTWSLETDRGILFVTNFDESIIQQIQQAEQGMTFLFCESVVTAAKKLRDEMIAAQAAQKAKAAGQPAAAGSLAETSSNSTVTVIDTAQRVNRLGKRQALMLSAGPAADEEARRRSRLAQSGFMLRPSSEWVPDGQLGSRIELQLPRL